MSMFSATATETHEKPAPVRLVTAGSGRAQPRLRRFVRSLSPQAWASFDLLIIGLATSAAHTLLSLFGEYDWGAAPWLTIGAFCSSIVCGGLVFGLYERRTLLERSRILVRTVLALSLGVLLGFACVSLFFYAVASRWIGLIVALSYVGVTVPLRLYAHEVITASRVRVLCIGDTGSIQKLADMLAYIRSRHYEVVGHVAVERGMERIVGGQIPGVLRPRFRSEAELRLEESCPSLGTLDDINRILCDYEIDEVIVASEFTASAQVGRAAAACLEARLRVTDQATFVEKLLGEVPAETISTDWFLNADLQNRASFDSAKRVMDIAIAALGLCLTLPAWPLIALLVRIDSRGPVLFSQTRVGQHGRLFTIYKFRTMRPDAEKHGAQWATANDARVTRIGRFLRRSRLDELPQLLNILRGDMSLIGPRPERPEFVRNLEQLLPHYRLRHLIKPGLSGWAQIHYRYGASVADAHRKLCFDLYYLKHRSFDLDLTILIRTFGTFVLGAR